MTESYIEIKIHNSLAIISFLKLPVIIQKYYELLRIDLKNNFENNFENFKQKFEELYDIMKSEFETVYTRDNKTHYLENIIRFNMLLLRLFYYSKVYNIQLPSSAYILYLRINDELLYSNVHYAYAQRYNESIMEDKRTLIPLWNRVVTLKDVKDLFIKNYIQDKRKMREIIEFVFSLSSTTTLQSSEELGGGKSRKRKSRRVKQER